MCSSAITCLAGLDDRQTTGVKMRRENRRRRTVSSLILNICILYCPPSLPVFLFSHFHTFRLPPSVSLSPSVFHALLFVCRAQPALFLQYGFMNAATCQGEIAMQYWAEWADAHFTHFTCRCSHKHKWKALLKAVLKEGNPLWKRVVHVVFFFFLTRIQTHSIHSLFPHTVC